MTVTLATCQFPTSADIRANADHVMKLCRSAKEKGAQLAHFCEGALSGYAGHDFPSISSIDWSVLKASTESILSVARELELWVVVGSTHQLTSPHLPHNSVYVVDPQGALVDRYDKRFLAGSSDTDGELTNYSPGDHATDFEVDGVRFTVHVCHEYRYPELIRAAKQRGVHCVLHSFHAAAATGSLLNTMKAHVPSPCRAASGGSTLPEITMPASMIAGAASSHMWFSCPNSSAPESSFGSFFIRADGVVTGRLGRHENGLLISTIDLNQPLYDSTKSWRDRAMAGQFHSGSLVMDPRSRNRTRL